MIRAFKEVLREERKKRGLEQQQVAARLSVVPAYISRMEKGMSHPSDELLVTICREFDLDLTEMVLLVASEKTTIAPVKDEYLRMLALHRREVEEGEIIRELMQDMVQA